MSREPFDFYNITLGGVRRLQTYRRASLLLYLYGDKLIAKMSLCRRSDIGLIGLAVMGQNLILNMNDHGFVVTAYNRTVAKVDEFLSKGAKGTNIVGAHSLEELVDSLKKPRRVMMLVKGTLDLQYIFLSSLCLLHFSIGNYNLCALPTTKPSIINEVLLLLKTNKYFEMF